MATHILDRVVGVLSRQRAAQKEQLAKRPEKVDPRVELAAIGPSSAPLVVAGGARLPEKARPGPVPSFQLDDAVGLLDDVAQRHAPAPLPVSRAQRSTTVGDASTATRRS